jgi:WD40 repeat protein
VGFIEFAAEDLLLRKDAVDGRSVVRLISLSEGRDVRLFDLARVSADPDRLHWASSRNSLLLFSGRPIEPPLHRLNVWKWPIESESPLHVGTTEIGPGARRQLSPDWTGDTWYWLQDRKILRGSAEDALHGVGDLVGEHSREISEIWPAGESSVIAVDEDDQYLVWIDEPGQSHTPRVFRPQFEFDRVRRDAISDSFSRWLAINGRESDERGVAVNAIALWDLNGPPGAAEQIFRLPILRGFDLHPAGTWLAAGVSAGVRLWPLKGPTPAVIPARQVQDLAFSPDGRWLAKADAARLILLPLRPDVATEPVELRRWNTVIHSISFDRAGDSVLVTGNGRAEIVEIESGEARHLEGFAEDAVFAADLDRAGRFAAAASAGGNEEGVIRVWDLDDGTVRLLDAKPYLESAGLPEVLVGPSGAERKGSIVTLAFLPDGQLVSSGWGSPALRWDLEQGSAEIVHPHVGRIAVSSDGRYLARHGAVSTTDPAAGDEFTVHDLETGARRTISSHGTRIRRFEIGPSGALVSGDQDGIVRVGPITGDEPYLLMGHPADFVRAIAVSPDGQWIATATNDEIRIWPMPDVDQPPLHTIPHGEFIEKLGSLTNYRIVRDERSDTDWKIEYGPFAGWKTVPTW